MPGAALEWGQLHYRSRFWSEETIPRQCWSTPRQIQTAEGRGRGEGGGKEGGRGEGKRREGEGRGKGGRERGGEKEGGRGEGERREGGDGRGGRQLSLFHSNSYNRLSMHMFMRDEKEGRKKQVLWV